MDQISEVSLKQVIYLGLAIAALLVVVLSVVLGISYCRKRRTANQFQKQLKAEVEKEELAIKEQKSKYRKSIRSQKHANALKQGFPWGMELNADQDEDEEAGKGL